MGSIIKGDLINLALAGHLDVIVHGCNCFCSMGAGIAQTIQQEFPEALAADMQTTSGDKEKLGNFSSATVTRFGHTITIINGYTQFAYHGRQVLVDYKAITRLFARLKKTYPGKRFGYPKIGAGLAGGNWTKISEIINRELHDEDHTLVLFTR